jgi:hypothetical protein
LDNSPAEAMARTAIKFKCKTRSSYSAFKNLEICLSAPSWRTWQKHS